jgi:DNA-binding NtrC family response regulator
MVSQGAFREDLYFHLSAVRIELPPLQARKPDIPLLASHFLEMYSEHGQTVRSISDAAMECLLAYAWPGNVLELERAIRWALSFASSAVVETDDLPPVVRVAASSRLRDPAARLSTMQPEYLAIIKALDATGGDRAAAAQLLHIAESALDSKLQSYGL